MVCIHRDEKMFYAGIDIIRYLDLNRMADPKFFGLTSSATTLLHLFDITLLTSGNILTPVSLQISFDFSILE